MQYFLLFITLIVCFAQIFYNNDQLKNILAFNQEELREELSKIGKVDIMQRPCRPWDACIEEEDNDDEERRREKT